MVGLLISFLVGLFFGGMVIKIWFDVDASHNSSGTIKIDCSDPDGPYLFLELERPEDVEILKKQKTALFKVDTNGYISQK